MQTYVARYLLPVSGPLIREGAVAVEDGRIVAVGSRAEVLATVGADAPVRDLGDAVVLPGLINAHTHLELSWMGSDPLPAGDYTDWIGAFLDKRRGVDHETAVAATEKALAEIASRGTVAVADVSNEFWTAPLLARSGLHAIVFHELYGMQADEAETNLEQAAGKLAELAADTDLIAAGGRVQIALTPHAPHTTSAPLLRALTGRAAASDEPLTIHVAESADEVELLRSGKGRLADLFRKLGFLDEAWEAPGSTPVRYLHGLGVLSQRTLAVHCVHLDQQDQSLLQAGRVTVVACPRSNEWLGVGTARIPKLLSAGVPVALGTDSLASAPDLDLFAEMAVLAGRQQGLAPAAVLRMATLNGARALGLDDRLGTIEPGKLASLFVVPLPDPAAKPFEVVCSNPETVHTLEEAPAEPAS
jgi:5-methylthioadenosine/S-adenosylhomocysteine deaminase